MVTIMQVLGIIDINNKLSNQYKIKNSLCFYMLHHTF